MLFLQQNPIDTVATALQTSGFKETISLLDISLKAWYVMLPLLLFSMYAIYLFVVKYLALMQATKNTESFLNSIKVFLNDGKLEGASAMCKSKEGVIPKMLDKGIANLDKTPAELEKLMETTGRIEMMHLEKGINFIGVIASIAPIFGFIGTILGVIQIFYKIALTDNISIGAIAEGLYTKMITSAAGLIVGLVAYVAFHLLQNKLNALALTMEETLQIFTDFITNNKRFQK